LLSQAKLIVLRDRIAVLETGKGSVNLLLGYLVLRKALVLFYSFRAECPIRFSRGLSRLLMIEPVFGSYLGSNAKRSWFILRSRA